MIISATLSKNIEMIQTVINYLKSKNVIFNKCMYTDILIRLIYTLDKFKREEYKEIIFEYINLGATISGYNEYTDYINSITFI